MSIARNIINSRKKKGLTQEQLAQKMNVGISSIFDWESGLETPNTNDIINLARALDVDPKEISEDVNLNYNASYNTNFNSNYNTNYNNEFQRFLQEDEELIWTGKPNPNFNKMTGRFITIPFGIFFLGFALFWTISASGFSVIFSLFGIPFIFVGIFILFGLPIFQKSMKNKTSYAITNKRIIIYKRTFNESINEIRLQNISSMNLVNYNNEVGTIYFNGANNMGYYHHHHHYNYGSHYGSNYYSRYNNYSLYGIDNVQNVYNIISNLINQNN